MIYLVMGYLFFWLIIFLYLLRLRKILNRLENEIKSIKDLRKD